MDVKAGQWSVAAASGGAILCVAALALWWRIQTPVPVALPPASPPPSERAASSAPPASENPLSGAPETPAPPLPTEAPVADVVRILPDGDVLVAGRAAPGAHVTLLDNGQALMAEDVNPKTGEFVFLPPRLPAGAHRLALRGEPAGGGPGAQRDLTAFNIAPEAKPAPQPAAVADAPAPPPPTAAALPPTTAAAQLPATAAERDSKTIAHGDTLWRISREKLGRGALYGSIFRANSGKIRDPNLIYPGQSLDIPPRD